MKYSPRVEIEEKITTILPANNGAGPLWCYGSPGIVRTKEDTLVCIYQPDPTLDRLCNTRWTIWKRAESGWSMIMQGDFYDEREPCPLARLPEERVIISVNPLIDRAAKTRGGNCDPHLLSITPPYETSSPVQHLPVWDTTRQFTEHSYRGLGVDYDEDHLLLLNIDGHDGYAWSLFSEEKWIRQGFFNFPIRACYPQIGLKNGAAHIMAIGDILETNSEWRSFKKEHTGNDWDYDFRRLFYTWSPDIRNEAFKENIEIASFEETAGYIRNCDLWVDADNQVHMLFITKNIWHEYLRPRFFPGHPVIHTLEYRVYKEGQHVSSQTLASYVKDDNEPDGSKIYFTSAGFHIDSNQRLHVVFLADDKLFILQVNPWEHDTPQAIPLQTSFNSFLMPTPRNGSYQSDTIDLYGTVMDSEYLHYARIRPGHISQEK